MQHPFIAARELNGSKPYAASATSFTVLGNLYAKSSSMHLTSTESYVKIAATT